jgi:glycosyltransferase involved in cell wall biosynthesis
VKIALISQRYGPEVLGGSEHLCRLVAERLAASHDVDVITTCARDYVTWKNEYAEGADRVKGVTVRRFPTAATRDIDAFNSYSDWIYANAHSQADEMSWLKQQGPWAPALIEYLKRSHQQYDVLIFFTYLYATTVLGLEVAPHRSILVSTAHDEPAIRLEMFKDVFRKPAALCYLTDSEREFVQAHFIERPLLEEVVGVGVDLPQQQPYPRMPERPSDEDGPQAGGDGGGSDEEPQGREVPSHLVARGAVFRRRHRLYGPIVLYGGRIDPGKGCEELIQYFSEYVKEGGDATLALMGVKLMALPEEPFIRFAGLLSERERLQALEAATGRPRRRRMKAFPCSRSNRCRSAPRFSSTHGRPSWSSTRSAATAACGTPTATSSSKR